MAKLSITKPLQGRQSPVTKGITERGPGIANQGQTAPVLRARHADTNRAKEKRATDKREKRREKDVILVPWAEGALGSRKGHEKP